MKIQAYKCRFTGKVFELSQKDKYITHLKELRKEMNKKRKYASIKKIHYDWLAAEKEKIVHIDMIVPWILKNQKHLMEAFNALRIDPSSKFYTKTDEFTSITLSAKYSTHVSNGWSRPHNGVKNWCGQHKDLPTGYPGFVGRMSGILKRDRKHGGQYPYGNLMRMIGINAECGGGGNESWVYDIKLFLADWPGLSQSVLFDTLNGKI